MDFCVVRGVMAVRSDSAVRVMEMPVVATDAADEEGLTTVTTFRSGSLRSNLRFRMEVDNSFRPLPPAPCTAAEGGGGGGGLSDDVLGSPARVTSSLFSTTMRLFDSVELLNVGGRSAVVGVAWLLTLPPVPPSSIISWSMGGGMKTGVILLLPSTVRVSICLSVGPLNVKVVKSRVRIAHVFNKNESPG